MRLSTILFSILAATTLSLAACGGGGGDGGDDTGGDDTALIDAGESTADAPPAGATGLGTACTPDAQNPQGQGSCEAGYVCLNLDGATGPYCSKTCDEMAANPTTECDALLNGPGLGYCLLGVDSTGDMMPDEYYCGIVCNDTGAGICTDCNDSCPNSYLQCTSPLQGGQPPMQVAEACE